LELQRELKGVDTAVEDLQRTMTALRSRKNKIPDDDDLEKVISLAQDIHDRVIAFEYSLADVTDGWWQK